ncbi:MAG: hypothetical protein M9916_05610 [Crocinitomicaceae bacterium]|nr:hypothetical protein [Crocinitomicaceae bacterium]
MNIIKYPLPINEIINRFHEAVNDCELRYRTSDLYKAGFETEADLNEALLKTIHILRMANLDTTHYLKRIYVTEIESGKTYIDWRMNKLAFFFVILNSECQNSIILQWKKKILNTIKT